MGRVLAALWVPFSTPFLLAVGVLPYPVLLPIAVLFWMPPGISALASAGLLGATLLFGTLVGWLGVPAGVFTVPCGPLALQPCCCRCHRDGVMAGPLVPYANSAGCTSLLDDESKNCMYRGAPSAPGVLLPHAIMASIITRFSVAPLKPCTFRMAGFRTPSKLSVCWTGLINRACCTEVLCLGFGVGFVRMRCA